MPTTNDSISFNLDSLSNQRSMMSSVVNMGSASHNWQEQATRTPEDAPTVELAGVVRGKHLAANSPVLPELGAEFQIRADEMKG